MWKLPYSGGWGIAEIHNIHYKNSQLISDYKDPIGVYIKYIFQFSSVVHLCLTLCDPMDSSTQGLPVHHQSLLKLMSIEQVMPSNHLILCQPLLLPSSIFPKVFAVELVLRIRWPKYWNFSFISPSKEHSGLISFRIGSPCSPRDSQESSPTPPFKSITTQVLSFLYGPTLISICDYWENHSFDQMDLCQQSNVSAF